MTKLRIGAVAAASLAVAGAVAAVVRAVVRRRRPWYRRIDAVVPMNGARAHARRLVRR